MTPLPVSIAAAVASFLLLVVVFELIRSRRLRARRRALRAVSARGGHSGGAVRGAGSVHARRRGGRGGVRGARLSGVVAAPSPPSRRPRITPRGPGGPRTRGRGARASHGI